MQRFFVFIEIGFLKADRIRLTHAALFSVRRYKVAVREERINVAGSQMFALPQSSERSARSDVAFRE